MQFDNDSAAKGHRSWRQHDRAKVSIMQVFRTAHAEKDSARAAVSTDDGGTLLEPSRRQRRDGVSEETLRQHIEADLIALLNTTRLSAAVSMEDHPNVAKSILNYGFRDLSGLKSHELNSPDIVESLRTSLINYEPRLIASSVEVNVTDTSGGKKQKLSITVRAELMGDPVDVPLDFDADVDLGAGKLKMSKIRIQQ